MDNNTPQPLLVKLGVWGIKTRATALAFIWICMGIAIVSAIRHFWIGLVMLLAAAWYWYAMRWIDKHGGWKAIHHMRSKRTKQLISSLMIIVVAIAAKTFLIEHFRIPQNGMYPGLPAGSGFWAYKRAYSASTQVKRGDIVVFTHLQNGQPYTYIWRVIGLPGDTIIAASESLTVNGRPVLHERIREEENAGIFREKIDEATFEVAFAQSPKHRPPDASLTVPPDHFFVMGDNRLNAFDSRYFGPISFSSIIGRKL